MVVVPGCQLNIFSRIFSTVQILNNFGLAGEESITVALFKSVWMNATKKVEQETFVFVCMCVRAHTVSTGVRQKATSSYPDFGWRGTLSV